MGKIFSTFGQELYQEVSIKSIEDFYGISDTNVLLQSIASLLPQKSIKTRKRVAEKIIQRFFTPPYPGETPRPFLDMVRLSDSLHDKTDLIFWRTAKTDRIIAAIASEIFYPYFLDAIIPGDYSEHEFNMLNTSALFNIDRVITTNFICEYAASKWNFTSKKSITLALRIMRQAGLIHSVPVRLISKRTTGFYLAQHYINANIFLFCLYEEFQKEGHAPIISLNQLQESDAMKVFFINRMQLNTMLEDLSKRYFIKSINQHGGRYIELLHPSTEALVSALFNS